MVRTIYMGFRLGWNLKREFGYCDRGRGLYGLDTTLMSIINNEVFSFDSFYLVLHFQLAELPVVLKRRTNSVLALRAANIGNESRQ